MNSTINTVPQELRKQGVETIISDVTRDLRIVVSPELAQWFLSIGHPNQRSIAPTEVAFYEGEIKAGRFVQYVLPGIYIDQRGFECNAQTRLTAQVRREATLGWMLRIGATDEEIQVLDDLRRRRPYQSLALADEPMKSRESSVYRMYERLLRSDEVISPTNIRMSTQALRELRDAYGSDIIWAVNAWAEKVAPASMVAALAYARPVMSATIDVFVQAYSDARLGLGSGRHGPGHPAVVLARFMNSDKPVAGGAHSLELVNKTLSALRAHAEGREPRHLISNRDTAKPLRFFKASRLASGLSG
jgi:hypothetical protein